jgi:hypothetical protein
MSDIMTGGADSAKVLGVLPNYFAPKGEEGEKPSLASTLPLIFTNHKLTPPRYISENNH